MPGSLPWTENLTVSKNQKKRFESFQWRMGKLFTARVGNIFIVAVGKVLDIYIRAIAR